MKLELELKQDVELEVLGADSWAVAQSQQTVTRSKVTRRVMSPSCLR